MRLHKIVQSYRPEGRILAGYIGFDVNISFTFQAVKNLSAHPTHLCSGLQSQSKWLGHFGVSLSPQCWCTRFGDQTAINNFGRDEGSTRREKTAFG